MTDALTELATRVRHLEALETAQVQIGEGPPTHEAAVTMMYWDKINYVLYVNHDGADGWTAIGP